MGSAANYYFNSPYVADAARNLASALAPPDANELLLRKQRQFELQTAQTNAANAASDREKDDLASNAIGEMYKLRSNPILGADGKPDVAATEHKAYEWADIAMANGKKDIRHEVDNALFEASPHFRRQKLLQQIVTGAASQRLAMQQSGMMDQIYARGDVQSQIQDQQDAAAMQRVQAQVAGRLAEWKVRAATAAKLNHITPITITPALANEVASQFLRHERLTGHRLTDEERLKFIDEGTQLSQTLRNPIAAADQVWSTHFPGEGGANAPTHEVPEPGNMNPFGSGSFINGLLQMLDKDPYFSDTFLSPDSQGAAPPATGAAPAEPPAPAQAPAPFVPTPGSAGAAIVTPPVKNPFQRNKDELAMEAEMRARAALETQSLPTSTSAAAAATAPPPPPSAKPREGDRAKSKKGLPMVFHNGRWEYE